MLFRWFLLTYVQTTHADQQERTHTCGHKRLCEAHAVQLAVPLQVIGHKDVSQLRELFQQAGGVRPLELPAET